MEGGLYVAFGVCGIFFVVALAAILWAFKNGEFEDLESTKFDMMDDELDGVKAARARALVEKARLNNSAST
jgi:nitrogen fixation-related uncharacterized protein